MTLQHFKIKVANHIIEVKTLHNRAYNVCRMYLCEEAPDFSVCITQKDIDCERDLYEEQMKQEAPSDVQLEVFALLSKITEELIDDNVLLIHGAAVAVDNKAYLFVGKSGIGKTTHVRKWIENIAEAEIINGDKPFIIVKDVPEVCGSPWSGKEGFNINKIVPLKAIVLLDRSEHNCIKKISFQEAFFKVYQQTYRSKNPEKMKRILNMLRALGDTVSFYDFKINNYSANSFCVSYNTLTNDVV